MNLIWITLSVTCLTAPPQDKSKPDADPKQPVANQVSNTALAMLALEQAGAQPKKGATLEDAINTALRNHPDIRIAQAKIQMAEAELAQARLVITQKITAAHADLAASKAQQQLAERNHHRMMELQKRSAISAEEYEDARLRLEQARASVAAKEASLQLLLGTPIQAAAPQPTINSVTTANLLATYLAAEQGDLVAMQGSIDKHLGLQLATRTPPQPIADRLKDTLDKPVSMEKQSGVELETFLQELLKRSSFDVKVRFPATENKQLSNNVTKLNLDAGEYPLRVWLQLVLDETNNYRNMNLQIDPSSARKPLRFDLYLREYGLLLSTPDLAPPDAITVQQYWKQLQAERASKEKGEKK
jgi:hypothetical protein